MQTITKFKVSCFDIFKQSASGYHIAKGLPQRIFSPASLLIKFYSDELFNMSSKDDLKTLLELVTEKLVKVTVSLSFDQRSSYVKLCSVKKQ